MNDEEVFGSSVPEDRVLYRDDKIRISLAASADDHDVCVRGTYRTAYCLLARGILNEWARTDAADLESRMRNYNDEFFMQMQEEGISVAELGWAFAKAKIRYLEQELSASYADREEQA